MKEKEELSKGAKIMEQLEMHRLKNLAKQYGTPLYVYDLRKIRSCTGIYQYYPRELTTVRYAVMANPASAIIGELQNSVRGFQVNSPKECELVRRFTALSYKDRVSVTTTNMSDDDLAFYVNQELFINFNSIQEIERYGNPRSWFTIDRKKDIGIRIQFRPIYNGKNATNQHPETKNRIGIQLSDIPRVLATAARHNLRITGIHGYVQSNCNNIEVFKELMDVAEKYALKLPNLTTVNLGGGFGLSFDWDEFGKCVGSWIGSLSQRLGHNLRLEIEPGRAMVSPAGYLITQVTNVTKHGGWREVGVDCGFGVFPRPFIYGRDSAGHHEVVGLKEKWTGGERLYTICGNTTLQGDYLAEDRPFPGRIKVGDYLAFLNAGAYCASLMSGFPGMRKAGEVAIDGRKTIVIQLHS